MTEGGFSDALLLPGFVYCRPQWYMNAGCSSTIAAAAAALISVLLRPTSCIVVPLLPRLIDEELRASHFLSVANEIDQLGSVGLQ